MSKRIYSVVGPQGEGLTKRLVRATTRGTAINHAAKGHFTAAIAKQDELVEHLSKGGKIEEAGEIDQADDQQQSASQPE